MIRQSPAGATSCGMVHISIPVPARMTAKIKMCRCSAPLIKRDRVALRGTFTTLVYFSYVTAKCIADKRSDGTPWSLMGVICLADERVQPRPGSKTPSTRCYEPGLDLPDIAYRKSGPTCLFPIGIRFSKRQFFDRAAGRSCWLRLHFLYPLITGRAWIRAAIRYILLGNNYKS